MAGADDGLHGGGAVAGIWVSSVVRIGPGRVVLGCRAGSLRWPRWKGGLLD